MKKYFLYSIILLCFISCEEDVKFDNPSFQGVKDNVFWRAVSSSAAASNSGVVINAYTRNEVVTLKTNGTTAKIYELGVSNAISASYVLSNAAGTIDYATGAGVGDGQIVITEYDATNKTISGTFRFNAENTLDNPLGDPILNFQQGVFYKVPIAP